MFQFMNTHTYVGLQQTHLLFVYGLKEAYKQKERSINWLPNFKSKNIYVPENVLWWGTYKCPYSKWWITMYKRPRPRQDSFLKFLWASRYIATSLLYCAVTSKVHPLEAFHWQIWPCRGGDPRQIFPAADQSERLHSKDMTHTRDSIDANNPHVYCSNYSSVLLCNWLNLGKNSEEKTQITSK